MSLVTGNRSKEFKYVYELPYTERKRLCNILDINDQWERLGGEKMGFSVLELTEIRRAERSGDSPTDRLLQFWGRKNNTILNLYYLLYSMEHFQAMNELLPFVPSEYHYENLEQQIPIEVFNAKISPQEKEQTEVTHFPTPDAHLLKDLRPPREVSLEDAEPSVAVQVTQACAVPLSSKDLVYHRPKISSSDKSESSPHKVTEKYMSVAKSKTQHEQSVTSSACEPRNFSSVEKSNLPTVKILNTVIPPNQERRERSYSIENNLEAAVNPAVNQPTKEYAQKMKVTVDKSEVTAEFSETQKPVFGNGSLEEKKVENILPNDPPPTHRERSQSHCSDISAVSECAVPMVSYKELEEATHFWNKSHLLGSGGFGSVYKGMWINVLVAIKRINPNNRKDGSGSSNITQIMDELRYLQKYRHDNILQVYGFSAEPDKPHCLVYQFMSNGCLEYRLQCRKVEAFSDSLPDPLMWHQRFSIARGTAAALHFLHTVQEKPLIHGDVKSANILLDRHMEPKLGDFGLAREGPLSDLTSMKVSHVHGTRPYLPEEYMRSKKLSTKVDTYSFGIVLFEICSGRRAYCDKTRKFLKDEVQDTKDRRLLRDSKAGLVCIKVFDVLFDIGLECINRIAKKRPDMTMVLQDLESFNKIIKAEDTINRRFSLQEYAIYGGSSQLPPPNFPSISTSPSNFFPHGYMPSGVMPAGIYPHLSPNPHAYPYTPSPSPVSPPLGWVKGFTPVVSTFPRDGIPVHNNFHCPQIGLKPPTKERGSISPQGKIEHRVLETSPVRTPTGISFTPPFQQPQGKHIFTQGFALSPQIEHEPQGCPPIPDISRLMGNSGSKEKEVTSTSDSSSRSSSSYTSETNMESNICAGHHSEANTKSDICIGHTNKNSNKIQGILQVGDEELSKNGNGDSSMKLNKNSLHSKEARIGQNHSEESGPNESSSDDFWKDLTFGPAGVCIPLLPQLGTVPTEEGKNKAVSAQGKKSFLD